MLRSGYNEAFEKRETLGRRCRRVVGISLMMSSIASIVNLEKKKLPQGSISDDDRLAPAPSFSPTVGLSLALVISSYRDSPATSSGYHYKL